jgi:tRNA pseudouridine55 synthase
MTSSAVLDTFKRYLPTGYGKIGHFGTLDPFAQGLYLIGVAGAQRLNDFIHDEFPKTYLATGLIGAKTDTGDRDGSVIEEGLADLPIDDLESLNEQLSTLFSYSNEYWQVPPSYSATKFEGKPLYEYARRGVVIDKPPVLRKIYSLEVLNYSAGVLQFRATVSSGTYIRTLFEDILKFFARVGHLTELVRESIGPLQLTEALEESYWPGPNTDEQYFSNHARCPMDILEYERVFYNEHQQGLFKNGVALRLDQLENAPRFNDGDKCWVCASHINGPLGLAQVRDGQLFVVLNFGRLAH